MFRGIDNDLRPLFGLGRDADDIRPLRVDHLPVVGVETFGRNAEASARLFQHVGAQVGAGDELGAVAGLVSGGVGVGLSEA